MATVDVQVFVDQHVYDHHGYDPADTLMSLMADNLDYNEIGSWSVTSNVEIPLDGRNYSGDTATRDIRSDFETWVKNNTSYDASSYHLIFDESDRGSWNGCALHNCSVGVGNRLANVDSISPPRWTQIDKASGFAVGDCYHITEQEIGHDLDLCGNGGCDGGVSDSGHGCGMNYDDSYNVYNTSSFPGDGDDFVRTAMECPDDNSEPNDCGTYGVDVASGGWDKNWADAYYWYHCAGDCLRTIWN